MSEDRQSGPQLEAQLDEFVSLERDLSERAALTAADVGGPVVSADRVSVEAVPDDYPVAVTTDAALRLGVEVTPESTATAFLEWPDEYGADDDLARLLDAVDLSADEFADLYGRWVALEYRDGHHVLDVERTAKGPDETAAPSSGGTASSIGMASTGAVRRPVPDTEAEAFSARSLAFAVDLVGVGVVAGGLWLLLFAVQLVAVGEQGDILGAFPVALRVLLWLLVGGIVGAYYGVLDGPYDGTVGKRAAGVTVATPEGAPVGARAALVRTAVLVAPLPLVALLHATLWLIGLPFGLLVWVAWVAIEAGLAATDDRRRRLGDRLAGTVVVKAE